LYQGFYNLKDCPFSLSPDPGFFYMTTQHREALSGLIYSVCTNAGLTVLLGEAGTGKTTLLYSLLELVRKRRFITTLCTNPTLTREEFYDLLMINLGIDCQSTLKSRQLAALEQTLLRSRSDGQPTILIVDEAQRLPAELLEEIRLLLNLETPREKLLEIIMSGQPELGEILGRPELRQLKQRISCMCKLNPLTLEEVHEYLHHRLVRAGLPSQTLFDNETIELVYHYSNGIPRLINSLCNATLQTGFAMQSKKITTAIVEEAARDLELGVLETPAILKTEAPNAPETDSRQPLHPAAVRNINGNGNGRDRMPLEDYPTRQKSLGFFGALIERWK